jgi:hypothetical protein
MKVFEKLSESKFQTLSVYDQKKIKGGVQTYRCTGCKDGTTSNDGWEDDGKV